jgi:hypothetical protein
MKALTNTDYYEILLQASKEAFESIEMKDFLYTDESMQESKQFIKFSQESIENLGIETTNNIIVNYQTSENITIAFIHYLERQQNKFEKKYIIPRSEFYKRCLISLNIKLTERNKNVRRKPLRSISSMDAPPEPLEFLEYMKWQIKVRATGVLEKQNNIIEVESIKPESKIKEKQITDFKTFFNKDFDENKIQKIKDKFKDLNGKKLAHLIYLLQSERKLINFYLRDDTLARKHFIQALTENKNVRTSGLDNFFESNSIELKDPHFAKDSGYTSIKNQLEAIIGVQ